MDHLPHTAPYDSRAPRRQGGMSLVELMVSVAIGLVLLLGMTTLFVNQGRTQAKLERTGRMVENGRYALQLLTDELQLAGYYGALQPSSGPGALPDPCSVANLGTDIGLHVQGYNGEPGTDVRPACLSGAGIEVKDGTDILVVRRAETTRREIDADGDGETIDEVNQLPATNVTYFLQTALCESTFPTTTIAKGNAFPQLQRNCTGLAAVRRLLVQTYFIAPENEPGDGIPTLKRRELTALGTFDTVPLVEGIEDLQVYYGRDTNNDGVADAFDNCAACTPAQWRQVVAAEVYLLARNTEETPGHENLNTYSLGPDVTGATAFSPEAVHVATHTHTRPHAYTHKHLHDAYQRHVFSEFVRIMNATMQ